MTSIRVPDTISKLNPDDTYAIVEGPDVGGFADLKTEVNTNTSKVEKAIDNVAALTKTGKAMLIKVVGDTPPDYGKEPHGNYVTTVRAMTKTLNLTTPDPLGGMLDGAIFTVFNDDPKDAIMVRPGDPKDTVNGGAGINIPAENFGTFIYDLSIRDFTELESGYIPAARINMANYVEQTLKGKDLLHTTQEIKAMGGPSGAAGVSIEVDGTTHADMTTLDMYDFTATVDTNDPKKLILKAPTGSAGIAIATQGGGGNAVTKSLTVMPPLEAYDDPNGGEFDSVLEIQHGFYAQAEAPQYYATLGYDEEVLGKEGQTNGHRDGTIWPSQVKVASGPYIQIDVPHKTIGLQEADEKDPNVTGGMNYKIGFRAVMQGTAPADGFVRAYLWDTQTGDYLRDTEGVLMADQRFYKKGDELGELLVIGAVNETGLQTFTMHVLDDFQADSITLTTGTSIAIEAITDESQTSLAWQAFELDSGYRFNYIHRWLGPKRATLQFMTGYEDKETTSNAGQYLNLSDGWALQAIEPTKISVNQGVVKMEAVGSDIGDFNFHKVFSASETRALHGYDVDVTLTIGNQDSSWNLVLVKWTGDADKYLPEIFQSRNNDAPAYEPGWVEADTLFINEAPMTPNHVITHTFTVPNDAVNYAIMLYPVAAQNPLTLTLDRFNVDVKEPFMSSILDSVTHIDELHLVKATEYKEFSQGNQGYPALRYTIGDTTTPMPVGEVGKGAADITLDPSVNVISSSAAHGGEGALLFNHDGKATIDTQLRLWSDQAKGVKSTVQFSWNTVESDGTLVEIPSSRFQCEVEGGAEGVLYNMSYTQDVVVNDRLALTAEADKADGAFVQAVAGKPLIVNKITLKGLTAIDYEDPFDTLDLHQFDKVYAGMKVAAKGVVNMSSVTFDMDIPSDMNMTVLSAMKQLPDTSVRPVRALDWVYSNVTKKLTVSFGETVVLGQILIGVIV